MSFYVLGSGNLLAEVMVENQATNLFHLLITVGGFIAFGLTPEEWRNPFSKNAAWPRRRGRVRA